MNKVNKRERSVSLFLGGKMSIGMIAREVGLSQSMVRKYVSDYNCEGRDELRWKIKEKMSRGKTCYRIGKELGLDTSVVYYHRDRILNFPVKRVVRISATGRVEMELYEMAREFAVPSDRIRRAIESGRLLEGYRYEWGVVDGG